MKQSYKKYYEANKTAICARMREREAAKRIELRQHLAQHPEDLPKVREKNRAKYHTWKANKILKQLQAWLSDELVGDSFKEFIKNHCLLNNTYALFTPSDIRTLEAMPKQKTTYELTKSRIVSDIQSLKNVIGADKSQNSFVPASIDGAIADLAEAYKGEAYKGEEATEA
jgi:hypothetical protein